MKQFEPHVIGRSVAQLETVGGSEVSTATLIGINNRVVVVGCDHHVRSAMEESADRPLIMRFLAHVGDLPFLYSLRLGVEYFLQDPSSDLACAWLRREDLERAKVSTFLFPLEFFDSGRVQIGECATLSWGFPVRYHDKHFLPVAHNVPNASIDYPVNQRLGTVRINGKGVLCGESGSPVMVIRPDKGVWCGIATGEDIGQSVYGLSEDGLGTATVQVHYVRDIVEKVQARRKSVPHWSGQSAHLSAEQRRHFIRMVRKHGRRDGESVIVAIPRVPRK